VYIGCVYPGQETSEMRSRLRLRTRVPGLNNRMDVLEIFSYDRQDGSEASLAGTCATPFTELAMCSLNAWNSLVEIQLVTNSTSEEFGTRKHGRIVATRMLETEI
jgi:hypothetical protein